MLMSEAVAKWLKLGGGIAGLVVALWAGFQVLDGMQDEVGRLSGIVDKLDSMVVKNDKWRLRSICEANGYTASNCPLLIHDLGGEPIIPAGSGAMLPEIKR